MKKFKELMEKAGDTAVFTFGRFNPPTTGHEKLIEAVAKQQSKNAGSKMYVYASQSNDPKKIHYHMQRRLRICVRCLRSMQKILSQANPELQSKLQ